jgi:hypothetical protein
VIPNGSLLNKEYVYPILCFILRAGYYSHINIESLCGQVRIVFDVRVMPVLLCKSAVLICAIAEPFTVAKKGPFYSSLAENHLRAISD